MSRSSFGGQLARILARAAQQGAEAVLRGSRADRRPGGGRQGQPRTPAGDAGGVPSRGPVPATASRAPAGGRYPGDFEGRPDVTYEPAHDGDPDPGEIVWAWVPYEEDHARGKDRPVLIIGRDGAWLLGLMLTSRDHDVDAADERRHGREWMDIGTGAWDRQGRPSEVRLDRVLRVDAGRVRREGAVLDGPRFAQVAAAVRAAN